MASVAIALSAALGSGLLIWTALRPRRVSPSMMEVGERRFGAPKVHADLLRQVPMVDVSGGDREANLAEVGAALASVAMAPVDEPSSLSAEAEASLIETTVGYIDAMTRPSSSAYMSLAKREPTAWIDPKDARWDFIDDAVEYGYGRPANRDDPQGELQAVYDFYRGRGGASLSKVSVDPRGLVVIFEHGRTATDLERSLILERLGSDSHEFLNGGGANQLRFRDPTTSVKDVLRRHHEILFAQTAVLLETEDGKPGVWHATWYWDPESGQWLNQSTRMESYYVMGMFY